MVFMRTLRRLGAAPTWRAAWPVPQPTSSSSAWRPTTRRCCLPSSPSPAFLPQTHPHGLLFLQVLKKISRYIQEQNEKVFAPRGLLLTDPVERGMRVVSFRDFTLAIGTPLPLVIGALCEFRALYFLNHMPSVLISGQPPCKGFEKLQSHMTFLTSSRGGSFLPYPPVCTRTLKVSWLGHLLAADCHSQDLSPGSVNL